MCSAGGAGCSPRRANSSSRLHRRCRAFAGVHVSSGLWVTVRALMSWPDAAFGAWRRSGVSLVCGGSPDALFRVLVNTGTPGGPAERLLLPTRRLGACGIGCRWLCAIRSTMLSDVAVVADAGIQWCMRELHTGGQESEVSGFTVHKIPA